MEGAALNRNPGAGPGHLYVTVCRDRGYGDTVSVFDADTPFAVALMFNVVVAETGLVVTENAPLCVPAGMTMLGTLGYATSGIELDSSTSIDPGAALHSRLAVPLTILPPVTLLGLRPTDPMPMGRTVSA